MGKWKFLAGLGLSLFAGASLAQSTIQFDVVFDAAYDASGNFVPNLTLMADGPFCNTTKQVPPCHVTPPVLAGHVVLTVAAGGTALTGTNTITLNGTFSSKAGNAPANNWADYNFSNATFDLFKPGSRIAINTAGTALSAADQPAFIATGADGTLSDHGPVSLYSGTCPYIGGCASLGPAGDAGAVSSDGTGIFGPGVSIFNTGTQTATHPAYKDAGFYPLISGTATEVNGVVVVGQPPNQPIAGLGMENGLDAFVFSGVLDTANGSQPYADQTKGYPGIVRILTFSTGVTSYMVQGHIVAPVPIPTAAWLFGSVLGLIGLARRRVLGMTVPVLAS
jgi:hypothetical protein